MDNTSDYIIEKIAPVFNSKGYVGTSLSDLTKATGLTKGALYGNFSNKEELAIQAFKYNLKKATSPLYHVLKEKTSSIGKLQAITDYYRGYYELATERGGCPILNVGIDSKHNNQALFDLARKETLRIINGLTQLIQEGIDSGELVDTIHPTRSANNMYSMIEGAIFLSLTQENKTYLEQILDYVDKSVIEKMKK